MSSRDGDNEGLAYGCLVSTMVEWFLLQLGAAERLLQQALAHAERAGSRWLETEILAELPGDLCERPAPALTGGARTRPPSAEGRGPPGAGGRPRARARALRGHAGRLHDGEGKVAASFAALEELGGDVITIAVHGMTLAELAWLEGDTHAEERHWRRLRAARGIRRARPPFDPRPLPGRSHAAARAGRRSRGISRRVPAADGVRQTSSITWEPTPSLRCSARGAARARRPPGSRAERSTARWPRIPSRCENGPSDHGRGNGQAAQRPAEAAAIWKVMLAESLAKECVPLAERARERLARLEVLL